MNKEEAIKAFGFDPETVGLRHRAWWIVSEIDQEEELAGAQVGYLCVKARDGGSNPVDVDAFKVGDCAGTAEDGFDRTYRYYYYRPLAARSGESA